MSLDVAIIGAGARGQLVYGQYCKDNPEKLRYIAAVEPDKERLKKVQQDHDISDKMIFENEDDFYKLGKVCDAVLICNQDKDHFKSVMECIKLGYPILLEKPITPSKKELTAIEEAVKKYNTKIMVCYVLRYTPFFTKLKQLINNQEIGKVIGIDHTEYIGNYHMAHSFVRGNWRNSVESSPIVLAKTSHDLDILVWLTGSEYTEVYSSGKLNYFKKENAPFGATKKCVNCPHNQSCIYDAKRFYIDALPGGWLNNVMANPSKEKARDFLESSNYGTCVYDIEDNDVCDHQTALIKFDNGIDVTFTVTAFNQDQTRFIRIFGTTGSIIANMEDNKITVHKHVIRETDEEEIKVIIPERANSGHGGGDKLIVDDFIQMVKNDNFDPITSFASAIQSHNLAFDLEESRVSNQIIKRK